MKNKPNFKKVLCLSVFSLVFSTITLAQTPGTWLGKTGTLAPCPTPKSTYSTTNAIGIGTSDPDGWQEIDYCNDQQNGLIVTKYNCSGIPNYLPAFPPTYDGIIQPVLPGETTGPVIFNPPLSFNLTQYNTFNAKPMIWARIENSALFQPQRSGNHTSRFIVTPYGQSGLNIENPRATLDIKCLGGRNMPAVIIGRQVVGTTNKTQHLHFVPLLSDNGYNQISVKDDQGMFFTDGMGTDGANVNGAFVIAPWANNRNPLVGGIRIDNMGNVQIHGETKTTKLNVNTTWWSDFVFNNNYKLRTLAEVETFITANKHLPDVPSETEILKNGIDVGNMQAIHMQKIEELTLYTIAQEKQLAAQQEAINKQQQEMEQLKLQVELLLQTKK